MANLLKRNSLGLAFFVAGIILAGLLGFYVQKTHAAPSTLAIQTSSTGTTTPVYMTAGTATSTYQIDAGGAFSTSKVLTMQPIDQVNVGIAFTASTSASTISITPQWSNNGIDWYGYDSATSATPNATTGTLLLASSTLSYLLSGSATASTTYTQIILPAIRANHERVVYADTIGNGSVYEEYDLLQLPETP